MKSAQTSTSTSVDELQLRLMPTPVDPLHFFTVESLLAWSTGKSLIPYQEPQLTPESPIDCKKRTQDIIQQASLRSMLPFDTVRLMTFLRENFDVGVVFDYPPSVLRAWLAQSNVDISYVYISSLGMRRLPLFYL